MGGHSNGVMDGHMAHFGVLTCISVETGASRLVRITGSTQRNATEMQYKA